jgi:thiol-disulfide isomerase/thioredoxin
MKTTFLKLGAIWVLMLFVMNTSAQTDTAAIVKAGDRMPAFKIVNGDEVLLSEVYKGKTIWINFFATWCPPCRKELPELKTQVWDKYKSDPGFVLLVIGREHSKDELLKFIESTGFDLPFYPDKDRAIYKLFAKSIIPRNVLIDHTGKVIYSGSGYQEEEFLKIIGLLEAELNR